MKNKIVGCIVLTLSLNMPIAQANSAPDIVITNLSSTHVMPLYLPLFKEYLAMVKSDWGTIYPGPYQVFIVDDIPDNLGLKPHSAIAVHTRDAEIYVSINMLLASQYTLYYAITHELAEMAINPHNDRFDHNGVPIEICDPYILVPLYLDHEQVAYYASPGYFGLQSNYKTSTHNKIERVE